MSVTLEALSHRSVQDVNGVRPSDGHPFGEETVTHTYVRVALCVRLHPLVPQEGDFHRERLR